MFEYQPRKAAELSRFIEAYPKLVFEAHSTDYQTRCSLRQVAQDHFAILKVGPALTFSLREGFLALAIFETQLPHLSSGSKPSNLLAVPENTMQSQPAYCQRYYHGDASSLCFAQRFSFNDRIRYYRISPQVQKSLRQLLANLSNVEIPLNLLSKSLPKQYAKIRTAEILSQPHAVLPDKEETVIPDYVFACDG